MILLRGIVILLCISLGGAVGAEGNENVPLVMHGLYSYRADASLFTDCQSGRSYPVALEGDNVALERAYLAVQHAPGEALLVTLEGRIVERPPMEGSGTVATLLPVRFLAITPGAGCARDGEAAVDRQAEVAAPFAGPDLARLFFQMRLQRADAFAGDGR